MTSWFFLFAAVAAFAADDVPPAPVPAPASAPASAPAKAAERVDVVTYHLSSLRSVSLATYPSGVSSITRKYLHFRNKDGNHYLVVEEDANESPVKEVEELRKAIAVPGVTCDIDIGCQKKAFCTGKCMNMYYQLSNGASPVLDGDRCRMLSFFCENPVESAAHP